MFVIENLGEDSTVMFEVSINNRAIDFIPLHMRNIFSNIKSVREEILDEWLVFITDLFYFAGVIVWKRKQGLKVPQELNVFFSETLKAISQIQLLQHRVQSTRPHFIFHSTEK